MADPRDESADDWLDSKERGPVPAESPASAYRTALGRYEEIRLVEIYKAQGQVDLALKPYALVGAIAEHLGESRVIDRMLTALGRGPGLAATLVSLTETTAWPLEGMAHALRALGVEPIPAIRSLVDLGLLAVSLGAEGGPLYDIGGAIEGRVDAPVTLLAHPSLPAAARTVLPEGGPLPAAGRVRLVRESDGLEPIIRLAALWQRVLDEPLRQTQQGVLYKRDRERLEDDPVLVGPIADALEPLPDMAPLWLALARGAGLLISEPAGERVVAAPPSYWDENAIHLPQMIAARWLALRTWHEQGGMQQEGSTAELAWPYVRPAVLLWLATLPEEEWAALDDLSAHLQTLSATWDLPCFLPGDVSTPAARPRGRRGRTEARTSASSQGTGILEATLLGAAYQSGLVRAAEEAPSGRRVVQLTALGRYVLALGPPPPSRPHFDRFLFVQPNFEMIAYRQGLNAALIGQFSRFARWTQAGAALELRLTAESVYRGLEGGLSPGEMLERLSKHSARSLPPGVAEALKAWAERRERVTYHASATLIEFASRDDLEAALRLWPQADRGAPVVVSDRLLLVEDEASIPFQRFRMTGSRDYRRPAEPCVEVESDGITLALDLARSDLLVDAELARFTEELPAERSPATPANPRRRFRVTPGSLARARGGGLTVALLAHWFPSRTGAPVPAAVQLMLLAGGSRVPPLATERPLVLHAPSAEVLDGLLQHPETRSLFGPRLGPTAAIVPDDSAPRLEAALAELGLSLAGPPGPSEPAPSQAVRRAGDAKSLGRGKGR